MLALSILGTTTVAAGRPLRDWRQWDILGAGTAHFRFDLMQNYPRLLDPAEDEVVMRVRSSVPTLLAGERPRGLQRLQLERRRPGRP